MQSTTETLLYSEDGLPEYTPLDLTLKDIRRIIPDRLFVRHTGLGLVYTARDLAMAAALWFCATKIDPTFQRSSVRAIVTPAGAETMRWVAWASYWWFQGLTLTGIWVIGHECGHGAFSASKPVCNILGYILHTALWTPYFSWKITHHKHHMHNSSMEKDEVYVPRTRSYLGIPKEEDKHPIDYKEYLGDTPIYTLLRLILIQLLAFPAYLCFNVSGQKTYPRWTNHFDPNSILFTPNQRNAVIMSDIGILCMAFLARYLHSIFGTASVVKYYGVPWLAVTHLFAMVTFLQHTDPRVPHLRKGAWSFPRGAACTVDRDFLGWQGRFFLHDVAHFHVVHHFFPKMPFYHGAEATGYLREVLGEHYIYSNAPVYKTLLENYSFCRFVEDEGDVVFYKNKRGQAVRRPAAEYRPRPTWRK